MSALLTLFGSAYPRSRHRICALWFFFLVAFQCAAQSSSTNALTPIKIPEASVSALRVMGSFVLVIGLFLAGVWIYKNWQGMIVRRTGIQPKLNIIESRSLGGRHALYVVGYEHQRMLLAVSPTGVGFLTHLPPDEPGSMPKTRESSLAPEPFSEALRKAHPGQ